MNKPHELALPATLPGVCATAARRSPPCGRAATNSTFDHQKNGPSCAGAARGVCSIHIPADLILLGTQGCVSRHDLLKLGRCFGIGRSLNRSGIGRRWRVSLAINHYSAEHSRNHAVQPFERHFKASGVYGPEHATGGIAVAQIHVGEIQNV